MTPILQMRAWHLGVKPIAWHLSSYMLWSQNSERVQALTPYQSASTNQELDAELEQGEGNTNVRG